MHKRFYQILLYRSRENKLELLSIKWNLGLKNFYEMFFDYLASYREVFHA